MKPILKAGSILAVAVVAGVFFCVAHPKPSGRVNPAKIMAAREQYAHDMKTRGSPLPTTVSLQELLRRRLLSPSDVSGFDGLEVAVSLRVKNPNTVLMRARMPDGNEVDLLEDGSVQQKSR